MRHVTIKKLSLESWKGITLDAVFGESKTFVRGENGIGKTTIYKAFCWLLTGYCDSLSGKNHELYDNKEPITKNTSAKVTATLSIDGVDYVLSKTAKPKFNRRGEKESTDSYTIELDGVGLSATYFKDWCDEVFGSADMLPYMVMGERFVNLSIDDRSKARSIMEQICGSLDHVEMFGDYSSIQDDMKRWNADILKERYSKMYKESESTAEKVLAIIESKRESLGALRSKDYENLEERKQTLLEELSHLTDNSKKLEKLDELSNRLAEVNSFKQEVIAAMNAEKNKEISELKGQLAYEEAKNEYRKKENKETELYLNDLKDSLSKRQEFVASLEKHQNELREQLKEAKSLLFDGDKCSYCGQELPFETIEENKRKFAEAKMAKIDSITSKGKQLAENILKEKDGIVYVEKLINAVKFNEMKDLSELEDKIKAAEKRVLFYESNKDFCNAIQEEKNIVAQIEALNVAQNSQENENKRKEIQKELDEIHRRIAYKAVLDDEAKSLKALEEKHKQLCAESIEILGKIETLKEYKQEYAVNVANVINSKLKDCSVTMFSAQKDGELRPDCVIVDKRGVKYATLNNSARLKTCLSVQRMFCEHYGVNMPMFVDECSIFSRGNIPEYDCQMVYLFASDDKEITITQE